MSKPPAKDQQTLELLHQLEREQPGLMKELTRLFVADAPRQMRLIAGCYTRRDPEGVRQSAHFLRSGALALGLSWLAEAAKNFELLTLESYGSGPSDQMLAELRSELHNVLLALLKELKVG